MQNGSAQSDFNSVTEWSHKLKLEILHELVFSKLERTSSSYPEKKAKQRKKEKNVVRNDSILSANCGIAVFYPGGQIFERKS